MIKNIQISALFLISVFLFVSCKKDKNKPKDPNSELPTLVSGSGWTVENKYKIDLKNQFLVSINSESVEKYNNDYYWKLKIEANDPIFGGSFSIVYFKLQNTTISDFVPQALNFDTKTDKFYFLENETSERAAVLNGGFKLYKDKTPVFSGDATTFWPNNITSIINFIPEYKYSICFNIANSSTTSVLNLETGKFIKFQMGGYNNGNFTIDVDYLKSNPNGFKAFYSNIDFIGNYKMRLNVLEICDTFKSKWGDPTTMAGYYNFTKPIDTSYLCDLGGIGYNFGDGYVKSVDAGNKVYISVSCKGMTDNFRLYTFDKTTRKLSFLYTHNGINFVNQLFYRKSKNDLILNTDKGLFKLDVNNLSFSDINPTISANTAIVKAYTQPYINGVYSDRIYGVACTLSGLTTTSNLVYYE